MSHVVLEISIIGIKTNGQLICGKSFLMPSNVVESIALAHVGFYVCGINVNSMIYGNYGFCVLSGFLIGKGLVKPLPLLFFIWVLSSDCNAVTKAEISTWRTVRSFAMDLRMARSMCAGREGLILVGAIGFSM
jgi:hypothetical protein